MKTPAKAAAVKPATPAAAKKTAASSSDSDSDDEPAKTPAKSAAKPTTPAAKKAASSSSSDSDVNCCYSLLLALASSSGWSIRTFVFIIIFLNFTRFRTNPL